ADERDAGVGAGLRELLVLAEKAIARMHGLRAGRLRGLDDALGAQVTLLRRRRPDVHGLVAGLHVLRVGVGVGVHGDGADTELARGRGHATGDLAAIGNQNLLEHLTGLEQMAVAWRTDRTHGAPAGAGIWRAPRSAPG